MLDFANKITAQQQHNFDKKRVQYNGLAISAGFKLM